MGPAALILVGLLLLPLLTAAVHQWRREPAFRRVIGTLVWPGLLMLAQPVAQSTVPPIGRWVMPLAVLGAAWVSGGGWRGLAFRPRQAPASALLGLAVVAGLAGVMVSAYARYGFSLRIMPPPGGWLFGGAALLLGALAVEGWLRGAVFSAARTWRGPGIALLVSALPPLIAAPGELPEITIWSLLMGATFGVVRFFTGDALGLAVPQAAGLLFLGTITTLR